MAKASAVKPQALAAPSVKTTSKAAFVTVACKVPTGVVLQLCKKTIWMEDTPSGARERVRFDPFGETYTVQGPATAVGSTPRGYKAPLVAGGYALTPNIPADFFAKWMEQHELNPIVKNKMIFAHGSKADTIKEAHELKFTRSGFEPLDVDNNDSRIPKPALGGVTPISTADEFAGRQHFPEAAEEVVTAADI